MKLFIDSANIDEIRDMAARGVVTGVTTNPSLLAKANPVGWKDVVADICRAVDGPVSVQVQRDRSWDMVTDGRQLTDIHGHVVVKVPATPDGLQACSVLSGEMGVRVNVTLVFTVAQALLAAAAGADFVSVFVGRLDDTGADGIGVVRKIAEVFGKMPLSPNLLAASIRSVDHVEEAARAGADIATVPHKILREMYNHPLTDAGLAKFREDWDNA